MPICFSWGRGFFSFYQQFWLKSLLTWSYFVGCYILLFDLVSIDNNLLFNWMESYCWYQFGSSIRRVLFDLIFFTYLFILFFISNYLKLLQLDANPEPVWPNGWVFVHELSGSGFESSCSHLNLRFRTCFEQGVPWHSGTYRVSIYSETLTWHDKNIQSQDSLTKIPTYLPSRMEYRWKCMLHEKFKEILSEMEYKNLSVK